MKLCNQDKQTHRWNANRYNHSKVDLGAMGMKGYFKLPKSPKLEPHHQMQFGIIPKYPFLGEGASYIFVGDTVSVF